MEGIGEVGWWRLMKKNCDELYLGSKLCDEREEEEDTKPSSAHTNIEEEEIETAA